MTVAEIIHPFSYSQATTYNSNGTSSLLVEAEFEVDGEVVSLIESSYSHAQ